MKWLCSRWPFSMVVTTSIRRQTSLLPLPSSPEVRIARLMHSRGFSEEDARNRLANQVPEEQRLSIADVVFTNNGSIGDFEAQISLWWEHEIAPRLK